MKKLDGWRTSVLSPVVAAVVKIAIHAKEVGCFSPTGYIIIQRHSGIFSEIRICKSLHFRLIRIRHCFCWCCSLMFMAEEFMLHLPADNCFHFPFRQALRRK